MTDWKKVAEQLYRVVLLAGGCTCDFERTKGGTPMWFPAEGGGIERRLIRRCSKCAAIAEFDRAMEVST